MAVTRTGSVACIQSSVNSDSQYVTVPSDATLAIVGTSGWSNGQDYFWSAGSLKLNNVPFGVAHADDGDSATYDATVLFYLKNPSVGSQLLEWDWTGSGNPSEGSHIIIAFYKGNDLTDPIRASGGQQQSDHDATTGAMSASSGDLAVAVAYGYNDQLISWTGATNQQQDFFNYCRGAFAEVAPSAAVTITASKAGGDDGYVTISGLVIRAASGGGGGRLNARWNNFNRRGQAWDHFWQDTPPDGTAGCSWGAPASWVATAIVAISATAAWAMPYGEAAAASVSITGTQAWSAPASWNSQASVTVGVGSAWAAAASWASQASVTVGTSAAWGAPGAWSSQASLAVGAAAAWGVSGSWDGQASLSITAGTAWERPGSWSVAASIPVSATMAWERPASWAGAGAIAITGDSVWERPASWLTAGSVAISATAAWSSPASWFVSATVGEGYGPIEATCQWDAPGSWAGTAAVEVGVAVAFGVPSTWEGNASVAIAAAQAWAAAFGWSAAVTVDVTATSAWSALGSWAGALMAWAPGTAEASIAACGGVEVSIGGASASCTASGSSAEAGHERTWQLCVALSAATVEVSHHA